MSKYKLLVADIDGTVVEHNSNGSEVNDKHPAKIAIDAARNQGKAITFATSRNYWWAKPVIDAFEITTPVIVNSGARVTNPVSDKVLWEKRLDTKKARLVCDFIVGRNMVRDQLIGFGYLEEIPLNQATDRSFNDLIYLDIIGFDNSEDIQAILKYIGGLDGVSAVAPPSPQMPGRNNIVVTNSEGTKYNALLELQQIVGISKAETISIGDGNNDLPLFEASGLTVAVDNASDQLKAAADLVVSSVHEHGMVEAINEQLIGRS